MACSAGAVVISVHQESEHDVTNIMKVIDKVKPPSRLFILVDEDVNPEDPLEVLWAIGTRFDPITGVRVSVTQSAWLLDPMRTTDQRAGHSAQPYKRLIINGCRPFEPPPYSWFRISAMSAAFARARS